MEWAEDGEEVVVAERRSDCHQRPVDRDVPFSVGVGTCNWRRGSEMRVERIEEGQLDYPLHTVCPPNAPAPLRRSIL